MTEMHEITLVCSTHGEHGLCSAAELLKILRVIGPEVIFEEIHPAVFDASYRVNRSLEFRAITQYRALQPCQQIPVDRYEIRPDLVMRMKAECDQVINYVGRTSEEYRRLDEEHVQQMAEHGFRYLNSDAFPTREARMSHLEDAQICALGNPDAMRVLQRWRHHNQAREAAMVASIYEYCRANTFDTGVFLVGAAHRTGIVKEIEKYASTEADLIIWRLHESQIR